MNKSQNQQNALDLLEKEDEKLRSIFVEFQANRGGDVEERAMYGDLAKSAIRHVATREAALLEVSNTIKAMPELQSLSSRLIRDLPKRRKAIDQVEKMSRGVHSINLNTGQDFDSEFTELMQIVGSEIEEDLAEVIPAVRGVLKQQGKMADLASARKVAKHAPTNLNPDGSQWYERAPIIGRALTLYDRLRDFPMASNRR